MRLANGRIGDPTAREPAGVDPRGSSISASGLPRVSARIRRARARPPALYDGLQQRPGVRLREAFDHQLRQAGELVVVSARAPRTPSPSARPASGGRRTRHLRGDVSSHCAPRRGRRAGAARLPRPAGSAPPAPGGSDPRAATRARTRPAALPAAAPAASPSRRASARTGDAVPRKPAPSRPARPRRARRDSRRPRGDVLQQGGLADPASPRRTNTALCPARTWCRTLSSAAHSLWRPHHPRQRGIDPTRSRSGRSRSLGRPVVPDGGRSAMLIPASHYCGSGSLANAEPECPHDVTRVPDQSAPSRRESSCQCRPPSAVLRTAKRHAAAPHFETDKDGHTSAPGCELISEGRLRPPGAPRPSTVGGASFKFFARPTGSAACRVRTARCSRSTSSGPATPGTTSIRRRDASTWSRRRRRRRGVLRRRDRGARSSGSAPARAAARARRAGCGRASARGSGRPRRTVGTARFGVRAPRRPGYDLTFSAPKSVSVLFGLGDPAIAARRSRSARPRRARGVRPLRAHGRGGPARARRAPRRAGRRVRRRGVPASHVARRRSAAAHARTGREPRARARRTLDCARRPAPLRAGAHDELHLSGRAAQRAHAQPRRGVAHGPRRHRRDRRRPEARDASVQPPPRRHRSRARPPRHVGCARGRSGGARDPPGQGPAHRHRHAVGELARAGRGARVRAARACPDARATDDASERSPSQTANDFSMRWRHRPASRAGRSTFDRRDVIQALCERLPADHAIDAGITRGTGRSVPRLLARRPTATRG